MTPRQIMAWNFLADRREDRESHRRVVLEILAHSGDKAAVEKQLDQWEKEGS